MAIRPYIPNSLVSSLPQGIWNGAYGLPVLPFLPGQTPVVTKAPLWSTEVIRSASGRERRTAYWPSPLWQFELSYEVIRHLPTNDELVVMWEFFNVAAGMYGAWLFVDPTDCQVFQVQGNPILDSAGNPILDSGGNPILDGSNVGDVFATGDGATTSFQLTRTLNSFQEPVYAVYGQTILDNGSAAGAYTIGPNGVITFSVAPVAGHTLSWYGYLYFGCRFLQDDLSFKRLMSYLWSGAKLGFTSIRP